jgi:hypothetical protein
VFPDNWKWDYTRNLGEHILGKMLDKAKNKGEPTYYLVPVFKVVLFVDDCLIIKGVNDFSL